MGSSGAVNSRLQDGADKHGRFFVLISRWKAIAARIRNQSTANPPSESRDIAKHNSAKELHGLIDVLLVVRRRILADSFLGAWVSWLSWILVALIAVAAFRNMLADAVILAVVLIGAGAGVIYAVARRIQPSTYNAACRLDALAGLRERLSTAIWFGEVENPGGILLRQRWDALARVSKVDSNALFPIRVPAAARRTLILTLVVAGMFVYRTYYGPPMAALLQTTARSRLLQSVLKPLSAITKDSKKALALVKKNPEASDETQVTASDQPPDDLWRKNDSTTDGQFASGKFDPQDENSSERQRNTDAAPPSQDPNDFGSLTKEIMKSLKKMLSKDKDDDDPPEGDSISPPMQAQLGQQQSAQNSPQSNTPPKSGTTEKSDSPPDNQSQAKMSRNGMDDQKNATHAADGAGDQKPGVKGLMKIGMNLNVKPVTDRVALQSTSYKNQPSTRAKVETGTAQMPIGSASLEGSAAVNGAEQEDVPVRYRQYLQNYFGQVDQSDQTGQPDKGQQ